jgi:hypothetical protein
MEDNEEGRELGVKCGKISVTSIIHYGQCAVNVRVRMDYNTLGLLPLRRLKGIKICKITRLKSARPHSMYTAPSIPRNSGIHCRIY